MNILVTGGAGYIGSLAVKRLLDKGHQVVVLDNLKTGHAESIDERVTAFFHNGVQEESFLSTIFKKKQISHVIHFAASSEAGESVSDPEKYFRNNLEGGLCLLSAMKRSGVKNLIFSSSAAVYGLPEYTPMDEDHPCKPISPYGSTKLMLEKIMQDYQKSYGLKSIALRYFNVAGAAEDSSLGEAHEPESHLIPKLLDVASGWSDYGRINGEDYPTPDGTCIRDYVHVEDLVQAHIRALDLLNQEFIDPVFNLGSERGFSVKEVLNVCRQVTGHSIPVIKGKRREGDPPILLASSERFRKLGWVLKYPDLDSMIKHAWNWQLRYKGRRRRSGT